MRRRRASIAVAVFGLANAAVLTLLQTGVVCSTGKRGEAEYPLGVPHGALTVASLAASLALASAGPAERADANPAVPLAAAASAAIGAASAIWFAAHNPPEERSLKPYAVGAAIASATIAALSAPEAVRALQSLRSE